MAVDKTVKAVEAAIEQMKAKKRSQGEASMVAQAVQQEFVSAMKPVLSEMTGAVKEALMSAIKGLKIEVPPTKFPPIEVNIPEIRVPEVKIPTINVPASVVNVPAPIVNVPKNEYPAFPSMMEVMMKGVDGKNPLPVMMMGTDGKPLMIPYGSGGSRANYLTLRELLTPNGDSMVDDSLDAIKVSVVATTSSSSGALQVSGAADSVNVMQVAGNDVAANSGVANSGTLRVVQALDVAVSVNVMQQDVTLDVRQVSGAENSVKITSQAAAIETRQVSGGEDSVSITSQSVTLDTRQVSGSADSVNLLQVGGTAAAALADDTANPTTFMFASLLMGFDSAAAQWDRLRTSAVNADGMTAHSHGVLDVASVNLGLNPSGTFDRIRTQAGTADGAMRTVLATDAVSSVNVVTLNGVAPNLGAGAVSTGTQRVVVGNDSTVMVVGNVVSDAADDGSGPMKVGGIARTANPTAVANGDRVSSTHDDVGRQVMRPLQVRDLLTTAYAALSTNTETTLLAGGGSGVFHDLLYVKFSNTSSVAVTIDLRDTTAGGIVDTYEVPANGVVGISLPVPIPQSEGGSSWTVDYNDSDLSNTTVYVSGLFSKEV